MLRRIFFVLAPVIIALVLYVLLKEPLNYVGNRVKNRRLACVLLFFTIALIPCVFIGIVAFRLYGGGLTDISRRFNDFYASICDFLEKIGVAELVMPYLDRFTSIKAVNVDRLLHLISVSAVNLALGAVMAFYLLVRERPFDGTRYVLRMLLPKWAYRALCDFVYICVEVLTGYVLGQLTDGVIMAVLISIGLSVVKIPFAVLIGVCAGFSNLVPYFGAFVGLLLTVVSGVMSGSLVRTLCGVGVMLALQQLDSVVIVPRVVGKRVEISPFAVIASLAVGGRTFGLWGMVLAVPVTAVGKIVVMRICERKKGEPQKDSP